MRCRFGVDGAQPAFYGAEDVLDGTAASGHRFEPALAGTQVQSLGQRAIGRLEHFGQRPDNVPGEARLKRDDLGDRVNGLFGIGAVERAANATNHGGYHLARFQIVAWGCLKYLWRLDGASWLLCQR